MFLVAPHLTARSRRLLGVVLLFAAAIFAAGWPGIISSSATADRWAAADYRAAAGDGAVAGEDAIPVGCTAGSQYQWSGHPFAVPHPSQSHQGQLPPVRLGLTFGDSAWNTCAADAGWAVVVTEQRAGAGLATQRRAPLWGSLQVREVRLQI